MQTNSALFWPQCGMGQELSLFLRPGISVENHARNGRSTKSFLDEGRFEAVRCGLCPGDLLLITFGHNDEKSADPARYCPAFGSYTENLRFFVQQARAAGALPVLMTPLCRRRFENGVLQPTHGDYPEAVRQLAQAEQVGLVDLTLRSRRLLLRLGEAGSPPLFMHLPVDAYGNYPDGCADNTHLRHEGAVRFCALAVQGLAALGGPYAAPLLPEWANPPQNERAAAEETGWTSVRQHPKQTLR